MTQDEALDLFKKAVDRYYKAGGTSDEMFEYIDDMDPGEDE